MRPGPRVDIVTGRPEPVDPGRSREAAAEFLAAEGHRLKRDLTTGDGPKHLQDMLDDYQQFAEQLMAAASVFKAEVPKDLLLAKMEYIQSRLKAWGQTVQFGRLARTRLQQDVVDGLLRGGPAGAD